IKIASIWRSFAFFDLITHFNSGFYVLSKNVAEIACKSVLTWVLFLICRLEFALIDFSLRNTIVRISFGQALSLLSIKSIKWIGSRYIPAIFGSHTTHLKIKAPKPYNIRDTAVFYMSGKRLRFYHDFYYFS
ncbi:hypothetical protein, partial [Acinetobacter johnsonii]